MLKLMYRFAAAEDLEQLIELRLLMQREVNPDVLVSPEYVETLRRYFLESLGNGSLLVAVTEDESKLISINSVVLYRKPPSITGGSGLFGYVSNVYTRPEWRGRGAASGLMRLMIEEARKRGVDRLHLGATEMGKGVYERAGFRPPRFTALELNFG